MSEQEHPGHFELKGVWQEAEDELEELEQQQSNDTRSRLEDYRSHGFGATASTSQDTDQWRDFDQSWGDVPHFDDEGESEYELPQPTQGYVPTALESSAEYDYMSSSGRLGAYADFYGHGKPQLPNVEKIKRNQPLSRGLTYTRKLDLIARKENRPRLQPVSPLKQEFGLDLDVDAQPSQTNEGGGSEAVSPMVDDDLRHLGPREEVSPITEDDAEPNRVMRPSEEMYDGDRSSSGGSSRASFSDGEDLDEMAPDVITRELRAAAMAQFGKSDAESLLRQEFGIVLRGVGVIRSSGSLDTLHDCAVNPERRQWQRLIRAEERKTSRQQATIRLQRHYLHEWAQHVARTTAAWEQTVAGTIQEYEGQIARLHAKHEADVGAAVGASMQGMLRDLHWQRQIAEAAKSKHADAKQKIESLETDNQRLRDELDSKPCISGDYDDRETQTSPLPMLMASDVDIKVGEKPHMWRVRSRIEASSSTEEPQSKAMTAVGLVRNFLNRMDEAFRVASTRGGDFSESEVIPPIPESRAREQAEMEKGQADRAKRYKELKERQARRLG